MRRLLRGGRRLAVAVGLVLGVVGGLSVPASAHAQLQSTSPGPGAVVPRSPGSVVLHFDESVEIQFGSVRVFDGSGHRVDSGRTAHPAGDHRAVSVAVPANLPAGGYVVTWRVISADSHPVHGAFTFQIGAAAGAPGALRAEAAGLLARGGGNRLVGVVFGVDRFADYSFVLLGLGAAAFLVLAWPEGRQSRRGRRLVVLALVAAAATTLAAFAIEGPYGGGLTLASAVKPSVLSGVWHTKFGHAAAARFALLVILVALSFPVMRRRGGRWTEGVFAVAGLAALATFAVAGHAGTGSLTALAVPFDLIHLGAAAVWLGGLVVILAVLLPAARAGDATLDGAASAATTRFSQWALGAVVAIGVTGVFAAWRQVSPLGALTGTTYGRLVIAKTAGFAIVIAIASASRTAVHGELALPFVRRRGTPAAGNATRSLGRAVAGEVVVIAAVLALTSLLVNAQPAKQAYAAPFSTEVHAGPDLVDVTASPAKAGPLAFHVYVLTADGAQLDVPEVRATMTDPSAGIDSLVVPLQKAGPGHYVAYNFTIPIRGNWRVFVVIRTTDINEYNADPFTLHIR